MLLTMLESATNPMALLQSLGSSGSTTNASSTESLTLRREKARRRTATTQDLLYPGGGGGDSSSTSPSTTPTATTTPTAVTTFLMPVHESPEDARLRLLSSTSSTSSSSPTSSSTTHPGLPSSSSTSTSTSGNRTPDHHTNGGGSAVPYGSANTETGDGGSDGSGGGNNGGEDKQYLVPPPRYPSLKKSVLPRPSSFRKMEPSPVLQRRVLNRSSSIGDTSSDTTTPPSSPSMARRGLMTRSTDDNVFSRLTNTASSLASPDPSRGSIVPSSSSRSSGPGPSASRAPLTLTHTAEGHTKAVLAICATDQLMFTGSKDRTVKSWDLGTGKELSSYPSHPATVTKVAFCPLKQLLFSVCQSSVRVWDVRRTTDNCIKTLSSSGLTTNGSASYTGRQSDGSQHEHQINDIKLSPDGQALFCAAGNVVQIWDLRRFSQAGKLCGHQAPVMAMALTRGPANCTMLISGSKDHYIKMFDVIEDAAGILWPKHNLIPPHYDGISSLALQGTTLFSGSRDMCIKKWDVTKQIHKHSINAAHKDWVCALDFVPGTNILLSGGRGGFLKLWHSDTCLNLGEIKAHNSPINAITTNSTSIFTTANDYVGIWRYRASLDFSDNKLELFDDDCLTPPLLPSPSSSSS